MTVVLAAVAALCAALAAFAFGLYFGERARRITAENNAGVWHPEPARRLPEPPDSAEQPALAELRDGLRFNRVLKRVDEMAPHLPQHLRARLAKRAQGFFNGVET